MPEEACSPTNFNPSTLPFVTLISKWRVYSSAYVLKILHAVNKLKEYSSSDWECLNVFIKNILDRLEIYCFFKCKELTNPTE